MGLTLARLKGFEKLTDVDDALQTFLEKLQPKTLGSEQTPISAANGRVTAQDIYAKYDLPQFDRSAVDGYAVRAKDTFGVSAVKPKTFMLTQGNVQENTAKELWTGNPVPDGADAVVMLEYTKKAEDKIEVTANVTPARNISKKGEDITKGAVAVPANVRLNPYHLALLAALNETDVCVVRRPKVEILATGNELVELGNKLEYGKIVETNRLMFTMLCNELGTHVLDLGLAKDDLDIITSKLLEGLQNADAVITTGGTSVGHPDLVPLAVTRIDPAGMVVHGVAIRSGMSTGLAVLNGKPVFVLSGNPASGTVGFELFTRPVLLKLLGVTEPRPVIKAKLTRRVAGALGRRIFLHVRVYEDDGGFFAEPVKVTGSGVLTTMARANGYVIVPENCEDLPEGETVSVNVFSALESK